MKKLALPLLLSSLIAAQANGQVLDNVQRVLNTLSAVAGQPAQSAAPQQAGPTFAQNQLTPKIAGDFQSKLTPGMETGPLAESWTSAKSLVIPIVVLAACGVGPWPQNGGQDEIEAWKTIGRWIDPDVKSPYSYGSFTLPIWHTQYHPKSACMTILRTDKWAKPSKNTLSFRVQFVSDVSDETVLVNYLFKMDEQGNWLFNSSNL